MSEWNIAVIQHFINEVWNERNLEVIEDIYAPDYQFHGAPFMG